MALDANNLIPDQVFNSPGDGYFIFSDTEAESVAACLAFNPLLEPIVAHAVRTNVAIGAATPALQFFNPRLFDNAH